MRDRDPREPQREPPEARQAVEEKYVALLDKRMAPDADKRIDIYTRDIERQASSSDDCRKQWFDWRRKEGQPETQNLDGVQQQFSVEKNLAYARALDAFVFKETGQSLRDAHAAERAARAAEAARTPKPLADRPPPATSPQNELRGTHADRPSARRGDDDQKRAEPAASPAPRARVVVVGTPAAPPDVRRPEQPKVSPLAALPTVRPLDRTKDAIVVDARQAQPRDDNERPPPPPQEPPRARPLPAPDADVTRDLPPRSTPEPVGAKFQARSAPGEAPAAAREDRAIDPAATTRDGPGPLPVPPRRETPIERTPQDEVIERDIRERMDRDARRDERHRDSFAQDFLRRAIDVQRDRPALYRHIEKDAERLREEPLLQTSKQLDRYLSQQNDLREEEPRGSETRNRLNARCCAVGVVRAEVRERELAGIRDFARSNLLDVRNDKESRHRLQEEVVGRCLDDPRYLNRGDRRRELERHLDDKADGAFRQPDEVRRAALAYEMKDPVRYQGDYEVMRFQDPRTYEAKEAAAHARLDASGQSVAEIRELYYRTEAMAVLDTSALKRADHRDEAREYAFLLQIAEKREERAGSNERSA